MTQPNVLFANNATTTLAANLTAGGTSMTVGSSAGFPSPSSPNYFYCTLVRASDSAIEIIKVTAVSGTTWTIVRAQDNTTALAFVTGDKAELRLTNAGLLDVQFGRLLGVQVFAAYYGSGTRTLTYTPTPGMKICRIKLQAPGGGGGSPQTSTNAQAGGGGGAGAYAEALFTAATIGASQTITVGEGGASASGPGVAASDGVAASVGTLMVCPGGKGAAACGTAGTSGISVGGIPTTAPSVTSALTTILTIKGAMGDYGIWPSASLAQGGKGGNSLLSPANGPVARTTAGNSQPAQWSAQAFGCGGAGGAAIADPGTGYGDAGGLGICIIEEYA